MAFANLLNFAGAKGRDQRMLARTGGHNDALIDTIGEELVQVELVGSDTTDGSGDVDKDLTATFAAISFVMFMTTGTTYHHLQKLDGLAAGHVGFRSFNAAGSAEATTAVTWTAIVVGTPA